MLFRYLEKTRWVLVGTFICSVGIELNQGFAKIGYFEVDDILNNVLGTLFGEMVYNLF